MIVMLNSLVAIASSLSATSTLSTSVVSTSTSGATKLTLALSASVKLTAGPEITDHMKVAILPSESLALALSVALSNP